MANHTLPLPSRLDAQPVLSLREVNSFIEEQIQRLPGRKRDKNRQRVNIPAIASLNSRKYRGQVMVSTIRKAKLKLRWSPEQISLRIDALLADQTLKDDDGWTGDMGLRPVSRMAIYRYIYGLNGNERNER